MSSNVIWTFPRSPIAPHDSTGKLDPVAADEVEVNVRVDEALTGVVAFSVAEDVFPTEDVEFRAEVDETGELDEAVDVGLASVVFIADVATEEVALRDVDVVARVAKVRTGSTTVLVSLAPMDSTPLVLCKGLLYPNVDDERVLPGGSEIVRTVVDPERRVRLTTEK